MPPNVDVVLVHGALHGAWCWAPTIPHLLADPRVGDVRAIDLPGHGANTAKAPDEITLDDYIETVVDAVRGADRPVVLVGHSLAGITITPTAHHAADRLARLVHVTTTCPTQGASTIDMLERETRGAGRVAANVPEMFCTDLTPAQREWLASRLGDEPAGPMSAPARYERPPTGVDTLYIVCERDEALSAAYQREQAARVGARVVSLDAGHSPFVSHPAELASLMLDGV